MIPKLTVFSIMNRNQISYSSFFRISISLLCITQIFSYGGNNNFNDIFSGKIISLDLMIAGLGGMNIILVKSIKYLNETLGELNAFLFLKYTYLFSLFLLIMGLITRPAALIAFICNQLIFFGQDLFTYGYDGFVSNSLLFCILFKTNYSLSIDNLILMNGREQTSAHEPKYLKHTIRGVLCIVYLFSGLSKAFDGLGWWNGDKMLAALHFSSSKSSLDIIDFLSNYPILLALGGISTVIIEISYPFLIFPKSTRPLTLALIIFLHILICFFLKLVPFSMIMIIWNVTAFYSIDSKDSSPNLDKKVSDVHSIEMA